MRTIHQDTGIVLNIAVAIALPIMPIRAVRAAVAVEITRAMPIRKTVCRHDCISDLKTTFLAQTVCLFFTRV